MSIKHWIPLISCVAGLLTSSTALAQSTAGDTELKLDPFKTSYAQIDRLVTAKKWPKLISLSTDLLRKDPANTTLLYWLGVSHLQIHEPVATIQALRLAEKNGLDAAIAHEALGLAYYDLNQFTLFEEQMNRAAALDAKDPKPDYYLGLYRWTIRSDASGALAYFEKALRLEPDNWKSLYQAGNCEEQLGRLAEAKSYYAKAVSLLELNGAPFGWPYQGMARLLLEDPNSALTFAKKAVSLEPTEASNHLVLANVYERMANWRDSVREAELAVEENPNDSSTRYALYKLYRESGDPRAAKELEMFTRIKALYDKD